MKFLVGLFLVGISLGNPLNGLPKEEGQAEVVPVVVVGGGIGALTSSLYLARAGLHPVVIMGKDPGGLLTQSHTVQNWPGENEIDGTELTNRVRKQAEANGAIFFNAEVVGVDFSKKPFSIKTRSINKENVSELRAEAVIIAMGTEPNFLKVPGESGYWGRGVTNCAICDGNLYRDQMVGVVGGGDAAVLEALYLSNLAKHVFVFVRKDTLKAIEEKRVQTLRAKSNVTILYNTSIQEIKGDGDKLTHVAVKTKDSEPTSFPLNGLFLAIGSQPNTRIFKDVLKLDDRGYIAVKHDQQTSIEGIYAIGDIVDPFYKQAISAAGDGAKAALQAQQYVSDRGGQWVSRVKQEKQNQELIAYNEVIEIFSDEQFQRELKMSAIPVVVDFYASWCGPCKRLSPILESSASSLSGRVKFLKVNVDKFNDLSKTYNVRAMPTVLMFDSSGKVLERKVGTEQISDLLKRLELEK